MNTTANDYLQTDWLDNRWLPYRNALPQERGFVDISQLDDDFGHRLIEGIVSGVPFELSAKATHELDERLRELYFDARYYEKARGIQSFALGFPLFVGQDPDGHQIAAPLMTWELSLEPSQRHNDGWKIKRLALHGLSANPFLLDYLKSNYDYDASGFFDKVLDDYHLDQKELFSLCHTLAEELGLETLPDELGLEATPSATEDIATGKIAYAGTLGIYPTPRAYLAGEAPDEQIEAPPPATFFSPLMLNPSQASAYNGLQRKHTAWVNGEGGTGKTQLGIHSLLSALLSGQRCLIVSKRVGTLHQYQHKMEEMGMGRLSFLLRDTPLDKALFLNIFRASATSKASEMELDARAFQIKLERAERLRQKLEQSYRSTRKKVFREHNWIDTVGLYLSSIRLEGKELLGTQVNASDYEFSDEEYASLRLDIADCNALFEKTTTLRSPLNKLNPGIFLRMEQEEARQFVAEKVAGLIEKGRRLRRWYINRMDAYATALAGHYEQYYQQYSGQLIDLKDNIADKYSQYGNQFGQRSQRSLRLKGVFSAQSRAMAEAQREIVEGYEQLASRFNRNAYFDFSFPNQKNYPGIEGVQKGLADFEASLQQWRLRQRELVQEESARLSRKSAHSRLQFAGELEELEQALNGFMEQINESGLYHLPLNNKTLTIPKQLRFLEEVLEQLEETQRSLPGFDNLYDWQSNWLRLDAKSRRLINVLVKVQPKNWVAAFQSWFLDNLLSRSYEAILPSSIADIESLGQLIEELNTSYVPYTLQHWYDTKEAAFRQLKRQHKKVYQDILKTGEATLSSYFALFPKAIDAVTASMPALLATPESAAATFDDQQEVFDLVIADEAQELSARESQYLRSLGKRCLFLGYAPLQSPCPAQLLVERQDGALSALQEIIAKYPANLFQAVQHRALGRVIRWEQGATRLENTGGRYDEEKEVNEEEALRIISILNEIEKTPQRTYPSVGIVCLTKGQRNLISSYLLGIKQRRSTGVEVIQQLERNGLMVLTLDELAGHQFDTLIVSSTFGPIDLEGNMTGHFHRLEHEGGLGKLQLMMSRTNSRLYFLNSVSESLLEELANETQLDGTHLFAYFIRFLHALEHQEPDALEASIQALADRLPEFEQDRQPGNFLEEVRSRLSDFLGSQRVEIQSGHPSALAPLMIHPSQPEEPAIALITDGFWAQTPSTDYWWEYQQLQKLAPYEVAPLSAVSANWWRSPEQEARKVASRVIQQEQQFVKVEEEE